MESWLQMMAQQEDHMSKPPSEPQAQPESDHPLGEARSEANSENVSQPASRPQPKRAAPAKRRKAESATQGTAAEGERQPGSPRDFGWLACNDPRVAQWRDVLREALSEVVAARPPSKQNR